MYGAITGLRFSGSGSDTVLEAVRQIMPRKPARYNGCDVCPKSEMPTVSLPGLEARLQQGYTGGNDGGTVLFGNDSAYNYGFTGKNKKAKNDGERLYWLV